MIYLRRRGEKEQVMPLLEKASKRLETEAMSHLPLAQRIIYALNG